MTVVPAVAQTVFLIDHIQHMDIQVQGRRRQLLRWPVVLAVLQM